MQFYEHFSIFFGVTIHRVPGWPWRHRSYLWAVCFVLLSAFHSTSALASGNIETKQVCFSESFDGVSFSYCVTKLKNSDDNTLLYHFHGRNLDETIWDDPTYFTEMLKRQWHESSLLPPTILTVSFGPVWVLSPKGDAKNTGLLNFFIDKALPQIEKRIGNPPATRFLLGESMGGFNAIQMLNKGLFKKVAILCPPIYDISYPFTFESTMGLVNRTNMEYKIALGFWWLASDFVKSSKDWNAISPLQIVSGLNSKDAPSIYLSCGNKDQYGNFPGTEKFCKVAKERGVQVDWHPLYARHCGIDIPSLAKFLAAKE
jgi:hypothetical protein